MSWNVTQCETKLFCEKMGTGSGLTQLCGLTVVQTRGEKTSEKPDKCCSTWPLSRTPKQITLSNAVMTKLENCVWGNVGADIISMKWQTDVKPHPQLMFLTTSDGCHEPSRSQRTRLVSLTVLQCNGPGRTAADPQLEDCEWKTNAQATPTKPHMFFVMTV